MTIPVARLLALPLLLALALALTACGDDASDSAGADPAPRVVLQVSTWIQGKGEADTEVPARSTVTCDGDLSADCAALLAVPAEVWAPVPADAACTKIYGGPGVVQVTGLVDGRSIDSTFTRNGGCEIRRWDAVVPLLQRMSVPVPGASTATAATAPPPIASGPTELTLTWFPKGPDAPGGKRVLTVTCPDVPLDTDKDCQELLDVAGGDLFDAELPAGTVCTQIFGGPQTVTVKGAIAGRPVDTTFNRTDGCQIDRWDRAVPLLLRMGRS